VGTLYSEVVCRVQVSARSIFPAFYGVFPRRVFKAFEARRPHIFSRPHPDKARRAVSTNVPPGSGAGGTSFEASLSLRASGCGSGERNICRFRPCLDRFQPSKYGAYSPISQRSLALSKKCTGVQQSSCGMRSALLNDPPRSAALLRCSRWV